MRRMIVVAALLGATPADAQDTPARLIQVTGSATVETAPDIAVLSITLRGEGRTADDATRQLATRQKAVTGGLAALLGADGEPKTGDVTVTQARGEGCADGADDDGKPRLSTGRCAVTGYIATMQMTLRTRQVTKAATAAGLASRLGASEARLDGFGLADPDAARTRARAAAVMAARRQAEALANGAGVRLGEVMTIRDQMDYDVVVTGARKSPAAPPAQMSPAPVEIEATPRPIDTRAQVFVAYAIAD